MKILGNSLFAIILIFSGLLSISCRSVGPTATVTSTPTATVTSTPTATVTSTPTATVTSTVATGDPYDNVEWPVIWVSLDPPEGSQYAQEIVTLIVPPGSTCEMVYIAEWSPGLYGSGHSLKFPTVAADRDGNAELTLTLHYYAFVPVGSHFPGYFEITNTKTDGTQIVIRHPFFTN